MNSSSPGSADGSPTASRDQVLEQDSSIETGSLPSDEKNKPILMDPHKPVLPPAGEALHFKQHLHYSRDTLDEWTQNKLRIDAASLDVTYFS